MIAMPHIKNYAKLGYSPSRILAETNNRLASMENVPYWQQELQLVQGDMLFLYTGGVVRAEDIKGNVYTETYLKQYLDELVKREISLKGIVDGLQNDLERFSEGRGQELDRTMVLLRYYG